MPIYLIGIACFLFATVLNSRRPKDNADSSIEENRKNYTKEYEKDTRIKKIAKIGVVLCVIVLIVSYLISMQS